MRASPLEPAALTLSIAAPLALWHTRFHDVPTLVGHWQGLTDPPGALRVCLSLLIGVTLAALLAQRPADVRRPFLAGALALAPLVPVTTGQLPLLLLFQGPALVVLIAAILGTALAAAGLDNGSRDRATPARLLFAIGFGAYAWLGTAIPGPAGPQGDEPHYLTMTESLLHDGDLDLQNQFDARAYSGFFAGRLRPHTSPASPPGTLYPVHTPGLPALLLPAYALGGYTGARLLMAALAALTGVLVYALVRDSVGRPRLALATWAAVSFIPPLPFFAVAIYPEVPAALATAGLLLLTRGPIGARGLLLATLAASALPWLHPKFLPLAALGFGLALLRAPGWRGRLLALTAALASIGLLLLFFHQVYGRAALSAAYGPGVATDVTLANAPQGALGLLLDRQFGLFSVSPSWLLALPGAVLLWRLRTGDTLRALLFGGATFGVGACFSMWWGGACAPARFVVPALPALALLMAPALGVWRRSAGALFGVGLGFVLLAADAPRALHNRADGQSALLQYLAPALDLDHLLPSVVRGAGPDEWLLALSLLAAVTLALHAGAKGLLAGALAYGALVGALRAQPLQDTDAAISGLLLAWEPARTWSPRGLPAQSALALPLAQAWTFDPTSVRTSRRVDLPPGAYRLEATGRVLDALPTAHVVRLEAYAGDLFLGQTYLLQGAPTPPLALLLPVGARKLAIVASGIQGHAVIDALRLLPEQVVPRSQRERLIWPRVPEEGRYRAGEGTVRASVLDWCVPEDAGFRIDGEQGFFVVEAPTGSAVAVRVRRLQANPDDSLDWDTLAQPLGPSPDATLTLAATVGVPVGSVRLIPVRVRSRDAWVAFTAAP